MGDEKTDRRLERDRERKRDIERIFSRLIEQNTEYRILFDNTLKYRSGVYMEMNVGACFGGREGVFLDGVFKKRSKRNVKVYIMTMYMMCVYTLCINCIYTFTFIITSLQYHIYIRDFIKRKSRDSLRLNYTSLSLSLYHTYHSVQHVDTK